MLTMPSPTCARVPTRAKPISTSFTEGGVGVNERRRDRVTDDLWWTSSCRCRRGNGGWLCWIVHSLFTPTIKQLDNCRKFSFLWGVLARDISYVEPLMWRVKFYIENLKYLGAWIFHIVLNSEKSKFNMFLPRIFLTHSPPSVFYVTFRSCQLSYTKKEQWNI